ncbi:hypothetical protein SRABI80_03321 [Peribacillus frigoritolerans]|nr:hypothetical protein SRABI80_03321 [Peribacillus frigoritolerans]
MLSKHHLQRDQLEMITLDQLVPANHLVRKMEASIDPVIIKPLYAKRKETIEHVFADAKEKHCMR